MLFLTLVVVFVLTGTLFTAAQAIRRVVEVLPPEIRTAGVSVRIVAVFEARNDPVILPRQRQLYLWLATCGICHLFGLQMFCWLLIP